MAEYDPNSLRKALMELERWAREMGSWFKPDLKPLPVLTIQSGSRHVLGWYAKAQWETAAGAIVDEINLVPENLARPVLDIAETLLHELVHHANYLAGLRDCTSNNYHNHHFRDRAISVGLVCERAGQYGWARTSLGTDLRDKIVALNPDPAAFELFRLPPARAEAPAAVATAVRAEGVVGTPYGNQATALRRRPKLSKWTCPGHCSPAWVASGTEMDAICRRCGGEFSRAS